MSIRTYYSNERGVQWHKIKKIKTINNLSLYYLYKNNSIWNHKKKKNGYYCSYSNFNHTQYIYYLDGYIRYLSFICIVSFYSLKSFALRAYVNIVKISLYLLFDLGVVVHSYQLYMTSGLKGYQGNIFCRL